VKRIYLFSTTLSLVATLGIAASPLLSCSPPPNSRPVAERSRPVSTDSGIIGQVLIGPNCPVVRKDVDCPDRPYQATMTILNQRGQVVTRFQTDAQGKFQVKLKPGKYILRPESPGVLPRAGEQNFTVTGRKFTSLQITYDSGLR
jgi:hypothetical protein